MSNDLRENYRTSALFGGNAEFMESFYEKYLQSPESVPAHWREYFEGMEQEAGRADVAHLPIRESFEQLARSRGNGHTAVSGGLSPDAAQRQAGVLRLINGYRVRGHQQARIDPLGLMERPYIPDLDPAYHGLGEADMGTEFNTGSLFAEERLPLRHIIDIVKSVYCGTIGAEYMHITDTAEKRWIQKRLEGSYGQTLFSEEEKRNILRHLSAAEGLEKYLHTRYVGQKRFSLEGCESLMPQLDDMITRAARAGVQDVVLGMAHRGRINVLVNLLGKSPKELFEEFEGKIDIESLSGSGDVKYHMGFSSDLEIEKQRVHLALAFNPSHLEIVNPVVVGSVRSRQERRGDRTGDNVLPVTIHGDASFSGQGVVMEVLNMSQARGFATGGTMHLIINNQIGFTTSNPLDSRSTPYCTDVAKMVQAPIFHVNGDDPEAVLFATRVALDFRNEFHKDVVIDLVCFRRHGHNEADEPSVTQPEMYRRIKDHPGTRSLYVQRLIEQQVTDDEQARAMIDEYRDGLDQGHNIVRKTLGMVGNEYTIDWSQYNTRDWNQKVDTSIPAERMRSLVERLTRLPEGFEPHSRVRRILDDRRKMAAGAVPVDWGLAENLAYASLVEDGYRVRLTGQDSGRGTFFHRHAVLFNQNDGQPWIPLQHIHPRQADFAVIDSLLSEEAVLGFEYGYSTADPSALVVWEAQYGDFANGAQVVIDQFISSGEAKWQRLCGLVMFLPHGYEGQGPEHSSARLERYLQLCAEHNMQVCVPSTPAQMFHMLRRQMLRPYRRPLVVMTPKSMLRRRLSTSQPEDLTGGRFRSVIGEVDELATDQVERVIFCSGKVFFDLLEARREAEEKRIALIRIEQLYPFPEEEYAAILEQYPAVKDIVWCQEEPRNQGAWYQVRHRLIRPLKREQTLSYVGRSASASTAAGYHELHVRQQRQLLAEALDLSKRKQTRKKTARRGKSAGARTSSGKKSTEKS